MELVGTIHKIYDEQRISDKFTKREFIIKTDEDSPFPQFVSIQLSNDKCNQIIGIKPSDMVRVQINIRGREWNGPQGIKYFNTIEAWKIENQNAE